MRIDTNTDYYIHITLSERNLRSLLSKVGRSDSHRTLSISTDKGMLHVTAEDDAAHYADREPGPVHPLDDSC